MKDNETKDTEEQSSGGDPAQPDGDKAPNGAKHASSRQVEANRRNALRSTGPRTVEGKQASKFNAVKYGLRAAEIVIPGHEDPAEFEALVQEYSEDWKPEGRTEISLVNDIALADWRLRRLPRAELGDIRAGLADARREQDGITNTLITASSLIPEILRESVAGVKRLESAVASVVNELEETNTVSEEAWDRVHRLFGHMPQNPTVWLVNLFTHAPGSISQDGKQSTPGHWRIKPGKKNGAIDDLKLLFKELLLLERKVRRQDTIKREIQRQRLSIPDRAELERLLRYETAIKRERQRTIDLLERLQRRRRGEPSAPTVNVNVSHDD